ncbi:hypothetical protein RRF57_000514 [Xylaria bambusicola]|uniref:Uncharacterized protein n=1 Tax=Xylaria bambusicola TaxID=326684 RepID=A0AAN7UAU5_9PEZI
MRAAVWNTVNGNLATLEGHGLLNAACVALGDVMSACAKSISAAAPVIISALSTFLKSTIRMLSGGSPRKSRCKTIWPPTPPQPPVTT